MYRPLNIGPENDAAIGARRIVRALGCYRRHLEILTQSFGFSARALLDGAASSLFTAGSCSKNKVQQPIAVTTIPPWGEPIRRNGFAADALWFGATPETIVADDGEEAGRFIPRIRQVIKNYKFRAYGDYSAWPGPNSNTFVQAVLSAVPELKAVLPPTAIGKDYPYEGDWFGLTTSRTGIYASLGGYLGLTIGWVEGFEINFFGAVLGFDIRRPALKFPGIGRLGVPVF